MQARKNKVLMSTLAVLVAVTAALWFWRGRSEEAERNDHIFNDFDVKAIDQVDLRSPKGSVALKFNGSRWMVNDQYVADPAMIEVMFATILQAIPKRPVAAVMLDSVAKALQERGTLVTLRASGATLGEFTAGGNEAKSQAYFLRKDQKTPYVMAIPGYRVYVSGIFELDESGWRDKRIFAFNWRLNFKQLTASFPASRSDDFQVNLKDNLLTVQGLPVVDSTRLNQFLNDVSQVAADEFVAANGSLDSLAKTQPAMRISVQDVGRTYSLHLFRFVDKQGRIAGLVNGTQWAMFSRQAVGSISRPRRFFEAKP